MGYHINYQSCYLGVLSCGRFSVEAQVHFRLWELKGFCHIAEPCSHKQSINK